MLIIDDHPLVIDGIRTMVKNVEYISVEGYAKTARDALSFLEDHPEIDLILLDINLPDRNGLDLCSEIRQHNKIVKIIGLSYANEAGITAQFLKNGADGFLLKNMERNELITAIDRVMAGGNYLSTAANDKIIQQIRKFDSDIQNIPALTRREKEILELLALVKRTSEIAEKLFLSNHTIDTHRKNMLQKFNVHNTQSLINKVKELGVF
ncbi:MAG: response regulator transcription factor [Saprospiraceae bacterium]|nr:response regulator transcription factor [Saprospiraceae bacterium]